MTTDPLFKSTYSEEIYSISPPLTIVMDTPWHSLTPESREALTKILTGVGLSPESVRMVHQDHLNISDWAEAPARLVAFVPPPTGVALYEKIQTPTTEMIISEPLSVLLTKEDVKRKFWSAFKTLFSS